MKSNGLLAKCSTLRVSRLAVASALLYAGASAAVRAQGFQGTVTSANGATVTTTTNTTQVDVTAPVAVINWQPTDNATNPGAAIDFLPAGNSANFTGATDYTVLNRVLPSDTSRPIGLNGTIQSFVNAVPSEGNVWFYSPGGILVASTAVVDVGGLLLTANDVVLDGNGLFDPNNFQLVSAPDSTSRIFTAPGSQINAVSEGSYVLAVAPVLDIKGDTRVNGSAGYVTAENVSISLNQGLFDITVNVGSSANAGTPLIFEGSTTGPASSGAGDYHRIYMVSVPKNDAITMFIAPTGDLGFDTASAATVEGDTIVLSAGRNIAFGQIDANSGGIELPNNDIEANAHLHGGTFTSDVIARATSDAFAASLIATPTFLQDVTLQGARNAHIGARIVGDTLMVGGNATVITDDIKNFTVANPSVTREINAAGGQSLIYSESGATVQIMGSATVTANALPGDNNITNTTGNAQGGQARIFTNGGAVNIAGDATLSAQAQQRGAGSAGTGGQASVVADLGGAITIGGALNVSADGVGGNVFAGTAPGGNGTGGSADVGIGNNGGSISVTGSTSLSATGTGGSVLASGAGAGSVGGTGQGGNAVVFIASSPNPSSLGFGDLSLFGSGSGGSGGAGATTGGDGGAGVAGSARINTTGGTVTLTGFTDLEAVGVGGDGGLGSNGGDGGGGAGTGGRAEVVGAGGGTLTLADIDILAPGTGGDGSIGGTGLGGVAALNAFGSDILFGNAVLNADGVGGFGVVGGAGIGGFNSSGSVTNPNGGVDITAVDADLVGASILASANGFGGDSTIGTGGNGSGGSIDSAAANGAGPSLFDVDDVTLVADGIGGAGGTGADGGTGTGGAVVMLAQTLNGNVDIGALLVDASGTGGAGGAGADGGAGAGGVGGRGGSGVGGSAGGLGSASGPEIGPAGGSASYVSIFASANGFGGAGGVGGAGATGGAGGAGGNATGGSSTLLARGGTLDAGGVTLAAFGIGGSGGLGGDASAAIGAGGNGSGGRAGALLTNKFQTADGATVTAGAFAASAGGIGGTGSTAGSNGFGQTFVDVQGSTASFDSIVLATSGDSPTRALVADPNAPPPGQVEVELTSSSGIRVVSGTLNVTNDLLVQTGSLGVVAAQSGAVNVGGLLSVQAGEIIAELQTVQTRVDNGDVQVFVDVLQEGVAAPTGPGTVDAAFLSLASVGAINAPANFSGGDVSISAGGAIALGGLASDSDLFVEAGESLTFGDVAANGDVELIASNGTLATGDVTGGGDVDLAASGDITAGVLTAGGAVTAASETGSVTLAGASAGLVNPSTDPETRPAIGIIAATGVTVTGTLAAAEDVGVVAGSGNASLAGIDAGGSVVVLAGGDIGTGAITASQVSGELVFLGDSANLPLLGDNFDPAGLLNGQILDAGNGAIIVSGPIIAGQFRAISNGPFSAQSSIAGAQSIQVQTAGVATFNGIASAPQVTVQSSDLDIGASGGLDAQSLSLVALATSAGPVIIGGNDDGPAYTLTADEAFRLEAQTVSFDVLAVNDQTPAQLLIRDIDISGSGGDGTTSVDVTVDGDIRVEGTIDYIDAGPTDTLSLGASGTIEVITPTGGIRITDDNNVTGILELDANRIVITDAQLAAQLAADPNFAGRNQALRTNNGANNPLGYVGAGAVVLESEGGGIFIQNTGGPTEFGGVTVGEGGLTIRSEDTDTPIALVGFGRRRNDDGSTVGGSAFFEEIEFSTDPQDPEEDPTQYTADSEFNSCVIGGSCQIVQQGTDVSSQIAAAISEPVFEAEADPEESDSESAGGGTDARFAGIIDTQGFDESALIEEPVIGSGNVSLWQGSIADQMDEEQCKEDEDAAPCPAESEERAGQ